MNPYIPNMLQGIINNPAHTNIIRTLYDQQEASRIAIVTRAISSGKIGRIKYSSTYWNARSVDKASIPAGTEVYLIERSGNTWLVSANHPHATEQAS
jgi:membrane protein implicated in regulation of membrane protease activity